MQKFKQAFASRQGPQNLYDRNGKFCPTFKSGTKKRLFSFPLLMTWCSQNAQNCTDLHLYFQTFPGSNTRGPTKLQRGKPLPRLLPLTSAHRPTFSELPRPLLHATEFQAYSPLSPLWLQWSDNNQVSCCQCEMCLMTTLSMLFHI